MMQEGLRHFSDIPLTVFGMMLFFVTYLGVVGWMAYSRDWSGIANLPLEGDSNE